MKLFPTQRPPAVSRLSRVYLWVTYSAGGWTAELSADDRGEHVLWAREGFARRDDALDAAAAWAAKRAMEVR